MNRPSLPPHPGTRASTREIWEYAGLILGLGFCHEWADLFAEDAVLEWPLAPAWLPRRMNGREEVRRLLTPVQERAIGSIKTRTNSTAAVHLTADPEVLVAELNADIELVTGQRFHNTLVHVIRVREGRIIHFKDYFDPSRAGSDYSASLEAIRQPG